jgi:hypothetical protein
VEEYAKFAGQYRFEGYDILTGEKVSDVLFKNVLTQEYFTRIFKFLNQAISAPLVDDLNLSHMATGTGTNPAMKANTSLQTEAFRKQISSKSYGLTNIVCKLALNPDESNFQIKEVGVFSKATDAPGSGTLISRCNVDIPKNANIKYLITFTLTNV